MVSEHIDIKVENLSKLYRIGVKEQIYDSLGRSIFEFIKSPLNNYRKYRSLYRFDDVETANGNKQTDHSNNVIWALNNVSFDVKKGEVLGIIGSNGAGKSTLLKILSRITDPTKGRAEIRGKVASLLEVGTGFHPELTGRENVYLNGTILGMTRKEVQQKFDEIVDFSGVEKFIDTPVKRYSSGMAVRLAFSVAAHLETDVLLVDEVLAVGDAAFQKKCAGKMNDVSKQGKTILFVSHNMAALENLCSRSILLREGVIADSGPTKEVIEGYLSSQSDLAKIPVSSRKDRRGIGEIIFSDIELLDRGKKPIACALSGQDIIIRLFYQNKVEREIKNCRASVLVSRNQRPYFNLSTELVDTKQLDLHKDGFIDFIIPKLPLSASTYQITVFLESNKQVQDWVLDAFEMPVEDGDFYGTGKNYPSGWRGLTVMVDYRWELGDNADGIYSF
jgi:lipopolysaccharide transport system ATP-binding protein